jgi:hypothetical protein
VLIPGRDNQQKRYPKRALAALIVQRLKNLAGRPEVDFAMSQRPRGNVIVPTAWRLTIMAIAIAGVAGCASQPAQAPRRDLLDVVADGRTHCAEVEGHLGAPGGWYEGARLMTYRISGDAQHALWLRCSLCRCRAMWE